MPPGTVANHPEPPKRAVLLPGTGSDGVFVRAVFRGPLAALGIVTVTPVPPARGGLVARMRAGLAAATRDRPAIVGGISLGAHVAAGWAASHPERCVGLLLAMPGWLGEPAGMPASVSAAATANAIDRDGLAVAIDSAAAGVPAWLAAELRRSWRRQGPGLSAVMREAASSTAPTEEALGAIRTATGIAGCTDDPVHPYRVAERYAAAIPGAALRATTLDAIGRSPDSLGRAAVRAWLVAREAGAAAR